MTVVVRPRVSGHRLDVQRSGGDSDDALTSAAAYRNSFTLIRWSAGPGDHGGKWQPRRVSVLSVAGLVVHGVAVALVFSLVAGLFALLGIVGPEASRCHRSRREGATMAAEGAECTWRIPPRCCVLPPVRLIVLTGPWSGH